MCHIWHIIWDQIFILFQYPLQYIFGTIVVCVALLPSSSTFTVHPFYIASSAPTTIVITVTLMLHSFFSSLVSFRQLLRSLFSIDFAW